MNVDDLLAQIPMDQLAAQLGVDEAEAERLARQAVPALIGGMEANAQDPSGEASLAQALQQHSGDAVGDGGFDLSAVDTGDGEKIVKHVFGDNEEQVVNQLGGLGGGSGTIAKLLPLLAPIIMGFLAKSFLGKKDESASSGMGPSDDDGGGGLGGLLGGLLGGGEGGGGLGGLGDVLGGLLGGGTK
jgi:hypothetical protein